MSPKEVVMSLLKLQELVDYEATDIVYYSSSKLSKSENALLIPKKSQNLSKAKQRVKRAKRGSR